MKCQTGAAQCTVGVQHGQCAEHCNWPLSWWNTVCTVQWSTVWFVVKQCVEQCVLQYIASPFGIRQSELLVKSDPTLATMPAH